MKQTVVILGSTGSVGQNTLAVLENLKDTFSVVGLAAGRRVELLAEQARAWRPKAVAIGADERLADLRDAAPDGCHVDGGADALVRLLEETNPDIVVSAVVGVAGLAATLRAVEMGKRVALANKEALVVAGSVLMPLARRTGSEIVPVDSEHSAVFQALQAGRMEDVEKICLTSSGGPFRTWSSERMARATIEDALNHPKWDMGPKITIDSATMMNKALEIIEARWLFDVRHDQIDVVIHPETIIHSLVEFVDGSMVAQMGTPDMRIPIQYALTYPARCLCSAERVCLHTLGQMTFFPPEPERFPALRLGHEVAERGGSAGAVLNAANEQANALFRSGNIDYADITALIEHVLDRHAFESSPELPALLAADQWARDEVDAAVLSRPRGVTR
jgi:1-deoxy-D-xylulose-5-phosphate reductoisomerase